MGALGWPTVPSPRLPKMGKGEGSRTMLWESIVLLLIFAVIAALWLFLIVRSVRTGGG